MSDFTPQPAPAAFPLTRAELQSDNLKGPTSLRYPPGDPAWGLNELFQTVERTTGLEVSIYPPTFSGEAPPTIAKLPVRYRWHMSEFCRAAKHTTDGLGCRGHDASMVNRKAGELKRPFVQVCHAGVAEAVVPILSEDDRHLGTVFIGQVVTPEIEAEGFAEVRLRVRGRVRDVDALQRGYDSLVRWDEDRLMQLAMMVDAAVRGLGRKLGAEAIDQEVRLQNAPSIRRALDIIRSERCWSITASEMADRVYLSPGYFSRSFQRIVGRPFSEYLTVRRIREAQHLLDKTDLPIGEIAYRCGFTRQSYFTRRFRQQTGLTPTQFRKRGDRKTPAPD